MSRRPRIRLALLCLAAALAAATAATAASPKLKVTVKGPATVLAGGQIAHKVTVSNAGKKGSVKGAKVGLLLSLDTKRDAKDVPLGRAVSLGTLKARKSATKTLKATIPAAAPARGYSVLACVTVKKVKKPICKASALTVTRPVVAGPNPPAVSPPAVSPAPPAVQPSPVPTPSPTPSPTPDPTPTPDPQPEPPDAPGAPKLEPAADPSQIAEPLPQAEPVSLAEATGFLYQGSTAIQKDVEAGTIKEKRVAVVRGKVTGRMNDAIGGVKVTVADHPEYGYTTTQADGGYDIAVNGGGPVTLVFERAGYIPAQRLVEVPWQDYTDVDPMVLVPYADESTLIDTTASGIQVAKADTVTDGEGSRTATLLFEPGTQGRAQLPGGRSKALDDKLRVRMTEYTQGANGLDAMPGQLPPTTAFTYAAEFSVDEAVQAGATEVTFSKPVISYTDNFLEMPVGTPVPTGYYDREREQWVGADNGLVIKILSETAGKADLDVDGDGAADTGDKLTVLSIDDAERTALAALYEPGKTLWRVLIEHFTPWDYNYPYGPGPGASGPNGPGPNGPGDGPNPPCPQAGSIILCDSQILAEELPLTGSDMSLFYRSDRVPGRTAERRIEIPLTGDTPPSGADFMGVEVEIDVAGRTISQHFDSVTAGQKYNFVWDGNDAYGRQVQGAQNTTVRVGYTWKAVYQAPSNFQQSWAQFSGANISGNRARQDFTIWQEYETKLGTYDVSGFGLGGWTLDTHHAYDPGSRTLLMGGGEMRSVDPSRLTVLSDFAGSWYSGYFGGDDGPALQAGLNEPTALAHGADGSVYIADTGNERIRKVSPGGTISTIAGDGTYGFAGDGGPASAARVSNPRGMAITEEGAIYIADTGANRVRRITTGGQIDTVAGGGTPIDGLGDGGDASDARLSVPSAVALAPDGTIYVADTGHHRVRRVDPSGQITTVAGDGDPGFAGDGGPAAVSRLRSPRGLAVDADGNLLISDTGNGRVRRVGIDGNIETIAGGGAAINDGGPATEAKMIDPIGVAMAPDGGVLIMDTGHARLRRVEQDGTIKTVAGGGDAYFSYTEQNLPATATRLYDPTAIAVSPDGTVYIAERQYHRIRKAGLLLEGFSEGDILIGAEDGTRLYHFSSTGLHKSTRDALTNGVIHSFEYDAQGKLSKVHDADSLRESDPAPALLTVQRDASGNATSLTARGGQQSALTMDGDGYLTTVKNPANETITLDYGAGGLLEKLIEPSGDEHVFTYDGVGRLTQDAGPGGLVKSLVRTQLAKGSKVDVTTGQGRTWTYLYERLGTGDERRTVTDPAGAETITTRRTDGTIHSKMPEGNTLEFRTEPDPRFGMQSPIAVEEKETSPAPNARTRTTTRSRTVSMEADNVTVSHQSESVAVNGRSTSRAYDNTDGPGGTLTSSTPQGRTIVTKLDGQGRVVEATNGQDTHAMQTTYDANGRISKVQQGTRYWTYTYEGTSRRVATRTDANGDAVSFTHDDGDRLESVTNAAGRTWTFDYDEDGNRVETTTPLTHAYGFSFTKDDLQSALALPGIGAGSYTRSYSADRLLTGRTDPSGAAQTWGYDAAGRLTSIQSAETATGFTYTGATEQLDTATWNRGGGDVEQTLAATFDGRLPKTTAFSGRATGTFTYTADSDHQVSTWAINAASVNKEYAIVRDSDRRITQEGPWTITRDPKTGEPRKYTDGTSSLDETHDGYGGLSSRTLKYGDSEKFKLEVVRDDSGQVTQKKETVAGTLTTYDYTYDAADRLKSVAKNGGEPSVFSYDDNGNRTNDAAQYDAQDRIEQLGATDYSFDADGFLDTRGDDDFDYGRRGELLRAQNAGDFDVTYDYDAFGRMVRRQSGSDSTQYLYGNPEDAFQITASIDEGNVLTTYFYDDEGALHGFERGSARYAVGSDQVNSPRVVTDSSGAVVKSVERDAWGNVVSDSAPAFELPIGFAGGIQDPQTGLVRFGMRDYDPVAGRWTARDPSFFEGSPLNLYAYVGNDPTSLRDPSGLICIGMNGYLGIGGGFQLCADGNGVGACAEVGVGLGGGVDADLLAAPENSDVGFAEVTAKVGPAGVTAGAEWDDCGNWKVGGTVGAGPVSVGGSVGSAGPQGTVKVGAGLEIGAKAGVKSCRSFSF